MIRPLTPLLISLTWLSCGLAWDPPSHLVRMEGLADLALFEQDSAAGNFSGRWSAEEASRAYRFTITEQGVYQITRNTLLGVGISPAELRGDNIRLFHRDREISAFPTTTGLFGNTDAVMFYAEGWDSTHTDQNTYWLALGENPTATPRRSGRALAGANTFSDLPQARLYRPRTQHAITLRPFDESFDHWIAAWILQSTTGLVSMPTPGPIVAGDATIAVRAADFQSSGSSMPTRSLVLSSGGNTLGGATYRGAGNVWSTLTTDAALLTEGVTTISILPTSNDAHLRDMAVEYPRMLRAENNRLCFDGRPGANNYECVGFAGGAVWIFDITDPAATEQLHDVSIAFGSLTFGDVTASGHTYFVQTATPTPINQLSPVTRPAILDLDQQRADLVIIANLDQFPSANTLASQRRSEGLDVVVADLQDVYDAYGYGLTHPDAIKQFLGAMYHHGRGAPPRYALLIGDGTSDPRRFRGHSETDWIPVHMGAGNFNYTGQDLWYGMVDGNDMRADLVIGRLPVNLNSEIAPILNKIQSFQNAPLTAGWRNQAHLCADKADTAGDFKARSEEMRIDWLAPNGVSTTTAYYDDIVAADWTTQANTAFGAGRRLIQYMGHGEAVDWSDVYGPSQVAALGNTTYPLVTAYACSSGSFFFPGIEGMSENLVVQNRGAVAVLAASAQAAERASAQIAHGYNEALWETKMYRLGDCIQHGLNTLFTWNAGSPELTYYTCIGDPSMIVNPVPATGDSDNDGLPNVWEMAEGLQPWIDDALLDPDGDALSNRGEFDEGTSPHDSDADGDQLLDGWEAALGSDPGDDDSDGDGMPDSWEIRYGLNILTSDHLFDLDNDGLSNREEYTAGSNPAEADSDADGLSDGDEVLTHGSDPLEQDTDGDGVQDGVEVNQLNTDPTDTDSDNNGMPDGFPEPPGGDADADGLSNLQEADAGTDPNKRDTDDDGIFDAAELILGTNPQVIDTDGDGLGDGQEVAAGSDPTKSDTDNDGLPDLWEISNSSDPMTANATADVDADGLSHLTEYIIGTHPGVGDTDNDGLLDGDELNPHLTDPLKPDTDNDGLDDGDELTIYFSNPLELDTDNDTLSDGFEISIGTDPTKTDSDDDTMPDAWERTNGLDPTLPDGAADRDSDGLSNIVEYNGGTRANNPDTDGDTLTDGAEVNTHMTNPLRRDSDSDGADDDEELAANTNPTNGDSDGDGLKDGFELDHGLNNNLNDAGLDPDNDTLTNLDEQTRRTNPHMADTDGDGLSDSYEVANSLLPYRADHDNDGVNDGDEVNVHGTNPIRSDTDGDGLRDGQEVSTYNTDPNKPDSDGDGMRDRDETRTGSNPNVIDVGADPDNDGLTNQQEFDNGTRGDDDDTDNDGLTDGIEVNTHNTDPTRADSDGDGLSDRNELQIHNTNPLEIDTDGDGMPDKWEVDQGIPADVVNGILDPDMDGLPHLQEYLFGTDPFKSDTDNDGLNDLVEVLAGTSSTIFDSDGDGMNDTYELAFGLDPNRNDADEDADADGISNQDEQIAGTHPNQPSSVLEITITHITNNIVRISWPSLPGKTYRLSATSALDTNTFINLQTGLVATPPENHVDLPDQAMQLFRVELE